MRKGAILEDLFDGSNEYRVLHAICYLLPDTNVSNSVINTQVSFTPGGKIVVLKAVSFSGKGPVPILRISSFHDTPPERIVVDKVGRWAEIYYARSFIDTNNVQLEPYSIDFFNHCITGDEKDIPLAVRAGLQFKPRRTAEEVYHDIISQNKAVISDRLSPTDSETSASLPG
ncbi:hypothetical protein HOD83_02955 [Candidatus Woesearchaeota archaeon]|jgi:hypothetical protein|nr:hypothetical protein [Candidatus Woesearchaeota archaeon]MBT4114077.1 hypothetical protein [Candidatus Woesearchaeota archaeon]MBT4248518.1 hypothetical protein [Candidatus Woesearchaeota archaeon]